MARIHLAQERNRQREVQKQAYQHERDHRIARSCFHGALRWRLHLTSCRQVMPQAGETRPTCK